MPVARRVDSGAGGRLRYPLFWHMVVALWWTATRPRVPWG